MNRNSYFQNNRERSQSPYKYAYQSNNRAQQAANSINYTNQSQNQMLTQGAFSNLVYEVPKSQENKEQKQEPQQQKIHAYLKQDLTLDVHLNVNVLGVVSAVLNEFAKHKFNMNEFSKFIDQQLEFEMKNENKQALMIVFCNMLHRILVFTGTPNFIEANNEVKYFYHRGNTNCGVAFNDEQERPNQSNQYSYSKIQLNMAYQIKTFLNEQYLKVDKTPIETRTLLLSKGFQPDQYTVFLSPKSTVGEAYQKQGYVSQYKGYSDAKKEAQDKWASLVFKCVDSFRKIIKYKENSFDDSNIKYVNDNFEPQINYSIDITKYRSLSVNNHGIYQLSPFTQSAKFIIDKQNSGKLVFDHMQQLSNCFNNGLIPYGLNAERELQQFITDNIINLTQLILQNSDLDPSVYTHGLNSQIFSNNLNNTLKQQLGYSLSPRQRSFVAMLDSDFLSDDAITKIQPIKFKEVTLLEKKIVGKSTDGISDAIVYIPHEYSELSDKQIEEVLQNKREITSTKTYQSKSSIQINMLDINECISLIMQNLNERLQNQQDQYYQKVLNMIEVQQYKQTELIKAFKAILNTQLLQPHKQIHCRQFNHSNYFLQGHLNNILPENCEFEIDQSQFNPFISLLKKYQYYSELITTSQMKHLKTNDKSFKDLMETEQQLLQYIIQNAKIIPLKRIAVIGEEDQQQEDDDELLYVNLANDFLQKRIKLDDENDVQIKKTSQLTGEFQIQIAEKNISGQQNFKYQKQEVRSEIDEPMSNDKLDLECASQESKLTHMTRLNQS